MFLYYVDLSIFLCLSVFACWVLPFALISSHYFQKTLPSSRNIFERIYCVHKMWKLPSTQWLFVISYYLSILRNRSGIYLASRMMYLHTYCIWFCCHAILWADARWSYSAGQTGSPLKRGWPRCFNYQNANTSLC